LITLRGAGFSGSSFFSNGLIFLLLGRLGFDYSSSSFFSNGLFSFPGLTFSTTSPFSTGESSVFYSFLKDLVNVYSSAFC